MHNNDFSNNCLTKNPPQFTQLACSNIFRRKYTQTLCTAIHTNLMHNNICKPYAQQYTQTLCTGIHTNSMHHSNLSLSYRHIDTPPNLALHHLNIHHSFESLRPTPLTFIASTAAKNVQIGIYICSPRFQ